MNTGHRKIALAASLAAVVASVLAVGPVAQAATTSEGHYCWASESMAYAACFSTEGAVNADVREKTGTDLVYPGDSSRQQARFDSAASNSDSPSVAATAYVLATIYDDQNYGVGSYTFTDTHSTTCAAYSYTFNTMPSGWDNRVSSFKSYGSCKTRLSENTNQGGRSVGPIASKAYVGDALNDTASSMYITG